MSKHLSKYLIKEFKNKEEMLNYQLIKNSLEYIELGEVYFEDNKLISENDKLWIEIYPPENAEFVVLNNQILFNNDYIDLNNL